MKKIFSFTAVLLSLALLLTCMPVGLVTFAEATDDIIFQAQPLKAGDVGSDVSVSKVGSSGNTATTYVASDENGEYFSYTNTFTGKGSGWNYYVFFKSGLNSSDLAWLNDGKTIGALNGFLTFSFDYQLIRSSAGFKEVKFDNFGFTDYPNANAGIKKFYPSTTLAKQGSTSVIWTKDSVLDTGWKTTSYVPTLADTYTFKDGVIGIKQYLNQEWAAGASVTVNLRNIKMTINSDNKNAINDALSAAGSEWTYDELVKSFKIAVSDDETIFQAQPLKVGNVGSDVSVSKVGSSGNTATTYVASDENGEYFSYTHTLSKTSGWNYYVFFKSGLDSSDLAWLNDGKTIGALNSYLTFSFDYRLIRSSGGFKAVKFDNFGFTDYPNANAGIKRFYPSTTLGSTSVLWTSDSVLDTGWKTTNYVPTLADTYTFKDGVIGIKQYLKQDWAAGASVTVNLRNIKLTLKSGFKDDINAALVAAGSEWTYDKLVNTFAYATTPADTIFAVNPDAVPVNYSDTVTPSDLSGNSAPAAGAYSIKRYNENDGTYIENRLRLAGGSGGSGTRTVIDTGVNAQTEGFGWLASAEVLNTLAPYLKFSYEYRLHNDFTTNKNITLIASANNKDGFITATNGGNPATYLSYKSGLSISDTVWSKTEREFTSFADKGWNDGYIAFWLYAYNNTAVGSVTVDLRNMQFNIHSKDKETINAALSNIEGINDIENFTKDVTIGKDAKGNNDYYSLLVGAGKVAAQYVYDPGNDYYSIWYADPELSADWESVDVRDINPDAVVSTQHQYKSDVYVDYDEDGNYFYSAAIDNSEQKQGSDMAGNTIVAPFNNNSVGYGWLERTTLLNTLAPYLYFAYDYRIPDYEILNKDTYLTFNAASEYNYKLKSFGRTKMIATEDWVCKYPVKATAEFADSWYNGYINYSIYCYYDLPETVYLDLRNIRLQLRESDREAINSALTEAGLEITFEDLVAKDKNYKALDTIWYASPDRAGNDVIDTELSSEGTNAVGTNVGYDVTVPVASNGGSDYKVVVNGGINGETEGFGWMNSSTLLEDLREYIYVSFDYKTDSILPEDTKLVLSTAGSLLSKVDLAGSSEWTSHYGLIEADAITNAFDGNLEITVESALGFADNTTVNIGIKNIKLLVKDYDADSINQKFEYSTSYVGRIPNFCNGLESDRIDADPSVGTTNYYDVYAHLCLAVNKLAKDFDIKDDGIVDAIDIVRAKKYLAGAAEVMDIIIARLDADNSKTINVTDLAAMRKFILSDKSVYYNDPIVVELVQDHPGVVNMDAEYALKLTDRESGSAITSGYTVETNSRDVTVDGLNLIVPYSVRSAEKQLTVTVTNGDKIGRYTFNFQKFSSEATLRDDFDSLNSNVWSTNGPGVEFVDGAMKFTGTADGQAPGVSCKEDYYQAYGSFSARIKMPASGVLANCAFWLRTQNGSYIYNPLNPKQSGGEIDIVEYYPTWGNRWSSSVHWNGWTSSHKKSAVDNLPGTNLADEYHVYSMVWTPYGIYSYLDGVLCRAYEGSGVAKDSDPMQIVINMGTKTQDTSWGGQYDSSKFPAYMYTDWLEIYSLAD